MYRQDSPLRPALAQELEGEGRLAGAGVALDQVQPAGGQAAAQDVVQPLDARRGPVAFGVRAVRPARGCLHRGLILVKHFPASHPESSLRPSVRVESSPNALGFNPAARDLRRRGRRNAAAPPAPGRGRRGRRTGNGPIRATGPPGGRTRPTPPPWAGRPGRPEPRGSSHGATRTEAVRTGPKGTGWPGAAGTRNSRNRAPARPKKAGGAWSGTMNRPEAPGAKPPPRGRTAKRGLTQSGPDTSPPVTPPQAPR